MTHFGHALLAIISVFNPHPRPKVYWQNGIPTCPAHWSAYSIESRALAGKDSAICVHEVTRAAWPDHSDEDSIHNLEGK